MPIVLRACVNLGDNVIVINRTRKGYYPATPVIQGSVGNNARVASTHKHTETELC